MSAPPTGSADGSPLPGFYPDPSIPGYIRYWNGTAWVPGTSRPEPREGEPMPVPPEGSSAYGGPAQAPVRATVPAARTEEPVAGAESGPPPSAEEEDGPDDARAGAAAGGGAPRGDGLPEVRARGDVSTRQVSSGEVSARDASSGEVAGRDAPPGEVAAPGVPSGETVTHWDDPRRLHGNRPEPATAWQADSGQQSGFGNDAERISWGSPAQAGPAASGGPPAADPRGGWGRTGGDDARAGEAATATGPAAASAAPEGAAARQPDPTDTVGIRMPRPVAGGGRGDAQGGAHGGGHGGLHGAGQAGLQGGGQAAAPPEHTVGLRRSDVLGTGSPAGTAPPAGPGAAGGGTPHGATGYAAGSPAAGPPPGRPPRPSWAQQVHDLAQQGGAAPGVPPQGGLPAQGVGGPDAVTPWRPPAADPFARHAQEARPAGLGRRLGARLVDGLFLSGVVGGVAFPFVGKTADHIQSKIDAANQAGETRDVWLIDGTTGVYLAVVLGALLLFGLLYEVLPTARWGRTPGKKLFGVRVLDIERQDTPGTGAALRRWLTYSLLGLLVLGVLNVLWCLVDRPWRQCWHDKVAGTFVARG